VVWALSDKTSPRSNSIVRLGGPSGCPLVAEKFGAKTLDKVALRLAGVKHELLRRVGKGA